MKKISRDLSRWVSKSKNKKVVDHWTARNTTLAAKSGVSSIESRDALVESGLSADYAEYAYAQNVLSVLLDGLLAAPALAKHAKVLETAQETYLPGFPPMSPNTQSFFNSWAYFDLAVGIDKETLVDCVLDLHNLVPMPEDLADLWRKLSESRLGLYECRGKTNHHIVLCELNNDKTHHVHSSTGFYGETGDVWLVRLVPSRYDKTIDTVTFTTPYILSSGVVQWKEFLNSGAWRDTRKLPSYENLMKYGLSHHYWNEFVFQAYEGLSPDRKAIYLSGLPDIGQTRPHFFDTQVRVLPERRRTILSSNINDSDRHGN